MRLSLKMVFGFFGWPSASSAVPGGGGDGNGLLELTSERTEPRGEITVPIVNEDGGELTLSL